VSPWPARRNADRPRPARRRGSRAYFVLVPLGLDGELLGGVVVVLSLGDVLVAGGVDGIVEDGGDADGVRSTGRSPTRSVRDSLQAVSSPRLSATAQTPVSILFIAISSLWGLRNPTGRVQRRCRRLLDRVRYNHYECKRRHGMKLEGSYEVPAPRKKVWDAFLDPKVLKQAIPGCEKLEAIGPDEYKATMKVGVGGVKGTFEGKVRLSDKNPPDSYKLAVEGSGGPGFIRGETVITLTDSGSGTKVSYTADLQVGGLIASVGQRMLGGVSKMMADKFFTRMSELLQA